MDKFANTIDRRVTHRKGFALVFTLSILAVIIALTGVLMGYFAKVKHDSTQTKALMQANLYYADIKTMLSKQSDRKSIYRKLYSMPQSFTSPDGRFSVMIRCHSLAKGVNINWLGFNSSREMRQQYDVALEVFQTIAQIYGLEDVDRLYEMLLESIISKGEFTKQEKSRLQQKQGILTYDQFEKIINTYQFEVDDRKISKVPWKKFFVFYPVGVTSASNVIDANYSSPELISILFDIDLQIVREWYGSPQGPSLKTFVNENNPEAYIAKKKVLANKFLEASECVVSYAYAGARYKFKFVDINKEVKNFEFYWKQ